MTATSKAQQDTNATTATSPSGKATYKRDSLREIERAVQRTWDEEKIFQCDPPSSFTPTDKQQKFMVTFPYPYMNGRLHLGHSFSLSKADFAAGFERMQGKRVLFPFAFHCTGMPIKAASDKLRKEMEQFGCPPTFPSADGSSDGKLKHSKVAAKSGGSKYQWQIMQQLGIPDSEIAKFADPVYWTRFFPPAAESDLRDFGSGIDWRRSFITTSLNPFYDAFIQWQFRRLRGQGKITFGKRYCIYSPLDGQPCLDHDRASGEGVEPKEFTAIKLQMVSLPECLGHLKDCKVSLLAATLRPETMYGQTNCWVGPEIEYGAFQISDQEIFVCTERAALNLAFQGFSRDAGKLERVGTCKGSDLIGSFVLGPLCSYPQIPVLPMMSVLSNVGTGIVTSVPASSPDDYAALKDLQEKEPLRRKFNLSDDVVLSIKAVPVVRTPTLGDLGAESLIKELKIKSQNDRELLDQAKEQLYKNEFYSGTLLVGEWSGRPVQEAKTLVRKYLIDSGLALPYYEPENRVVSRSGDDCVVCLTDQWFISYGEEKWRKETEKALSKLNCFLPEVRHQFEATLAWMQQWACSRSFGLGSRLPWDPQYLIESLSDSTIYMAYYTIAHILHEGSLDGSVRPNGITPDQMTDEVFDYIFADGDMPKSSAIPEHLLLRMRHEFRFFYPMDLRVSGKDLVPNHLTFFIYNHVALFDEQNWPLGVRANGHLLLNGQKMSKSTGNFMTMSESCARFGADATRIALADAGDSLEDANFVEDTADKAILRLFTNMEAIADVCSNKDNYRDGPCDALFADRAFSAEMDAAVDHCIKAYKAANYREALHAAFYGLQNARDYYRDCTSVHGSTKMNIQLMRRFAALCCQLMAPITPHYCEHVWRNVLKKEGSIFKAGLPELKSPDESVLAALEYIRTTCHGLRAQISSSKSPVSSATLFVASTFPKWQEDTVAIVRASYCDGSFQPDEEIVKLLKPVIAEHGKIPGVTKKIIPFAMELKRQVAAAGLKMLDRALPFNELQVVNDSVDYLAQSLGLMGLDVVSCASSGCDELPVDAKRKMDAAEPGRPSVRLS